MRIHKVYLQCAGIAALFLVIILIGWQWLAQSLEEESSPSGALTMHRTSSGSWELHRDGKPFLIRGAGGEKHLDVLVESGGNAIRTWGIEDLNERINGKTLVERAQERDLMIAAGIWVSHARHGFDYGDPAQIQSQRQQIQRAVAQWKHEPTIGIWGLGNEMEDGSNDVRLWTELEELAKITKKEDPSRLIMTVIAGAAPEKIQSLLDHCPSIDILGINAYAAAPRAAKEVKAAGWKKPFILSEFGTRGHWEVAKTEWGAPVEQTSKEKIASYSSTYQTSHQESGGLSVGSFVFYWGQKQERTPTWYSMFLPSGEKLPPVDAMAREWTGQWPANRCPQIEQFHSPASRATVKPGEAITVNFVVTDPEEASLQVDWSLAPESTDLKKGGDLESAPSETPVTMRSAGEHLWTFAAPDRPGNYRLFVVVRDGKGAANAENFPFRVR